MITSYTLANWDGKLRDVSQQIPSYPSSSSTSLPGGESLNNCNSNEQMDVDKGGHSLDKPVERGRDENSEESLQSTSVAEVSEHRQTEHKPSNPRLTVITANTAPNASGEIQDQQRAFLPILDSPLHAYYASKGITSDQQQFTLQATELNHAQSAVSAYSLHSADAEGEADDNVGNMSVNDVLPNLSPFQTDSRSRTNPPSPITFLNSDPLFTPPPSNRCKSVERLFTPEPPRQAKPIRSRRIMSHVEVPQLVKPRAEYKRIFPPKKKSNAGVKVHPSIGDAIQSSMNNNESLGTLPTPKPHSIGKKMMMKKKKDGLLRVEPKNATPGPSRLPMESTPSLISNKKPQKKHNNAHENLKKTTEKKNKTRPVDIDLTLSDVEMPLVKPKSTRLVPPVHTIYEPGSKKTVLILQPIVPVDSQILFCNTRFLKTAHNSETSIPTSTLAPKTTDQDKIEVPWFCRVPRLSTTESEEISLGTAVLSLWESNHKVYEVEDSDDEIVEFIEAPAKAPTVVPPKIDLAAQFLKRKKSNTQKSASKAKPTPSSVPPAPSIAARTPSILGSTSQHQVLPSTDNEMESDLLFPAYPSEKALGKRKAVTPEPFETVDSPYTASYPYHLPQPTTNYTPSVEHMRDPDKLDIFIHNFGPSPSNRKSSTVYHMPLDSPSRNPTIDGADETDPPLIDMFLVNPLAVDDAAGSELYSQIGDNDDDLISRQQPTYSWPNIGESLTHYRVDTVDPTLLGGPQTDTEFFESEFGAQSEPESTVKSATNDQKKDGIPLSIANYSSSSSSSGSRAVSSAVDNPQVNLPPPISSLKRKRRPSVTSVSPVERRPQRRVVPRLFPDMVPSTGLRFHKRGFVSTTPFTLPGPSKSSGLSRGSFPVLSTSRKTSTSSDYVPTSPTSEGATSSHTELVEPEIIVRHKKATAPPVQAAFIPLQNLPSTVNGPWPTSTELSDVCCHQCRRKTNLLKLICACNKIFCVRCLTLRYPDEIFSYDKQAPDCPFCKKYCNCTSCCAKRGDVYVSQGRGRRPPGHRPEPVTNSARVSQVQVVQRIQCGPVVIPQSAMYWATMYDMEGRKIGPTFATPTLGGDGHPEVVFAKIDPQAVVPQREAKKGKRVFIGAIQGIWDLGQRPKVRLLKPITKSTQPTIADIRASGRPFVGSRSFLHHKIQKRKSSEELDDDDILGSLSPLTSLEGSEAEDMQESQPPSIEIASQSMTLPELFIQHSRPLGSLTHSVKL